MSEVIQFPTDGHTNGLSAAQVNAVITSAYPLLERGVADTAEPDHTDDGAVYVAIEQEDGPGWLAAKEDGAYLLFTPGRRPPLVSSPHFDDLIAGVHAIAG